MTHNPRHLLMTLALASVTCLGLVGCGGSGRMTISSQIQPDQSLIGRFEQGIYRVDDSSSATILLLDGPIEQPRQAVTIRLFWQPRAGRTPIGAEATNAVIHYIIFDDQDHDASVGVYSGAGFLLGSRVGKARFTARLMNANLQLADSSEQFVDQLDRALVQGSLSAQRDDAALESHLRRLNMLIRQRLGYPRLVNQAPVEPSHTAWQAKQTHLAAVR